MLLSTSLLRFDMLSYFKITVCRRMRIKIMKILIKRIKFWQCFPFTEYSQSFSIIFLKAIKMFALIDFSSFNFFYVEWESPF